MSIRIAVLWVLLALFCSDALAATPAGTVIRNQASAIYKDEQGREFTVVSNVVETTIEQVAGLELTQDQQQMGMPNAVVSFSHRLTNTGNGDDRYRLQVTNTGNDSLDLSVINIFLDANQDGIADNATPIYETPWVAAGADLFLIVQGVIPSYANNNDAAVIELLAQSQFETGLSKINSDTINVGIGGIVVTTKSISENAGVSPSGPYTITLNYQNVGSAAANEVTLIDALPDGMTYNPGSAQWSLSSTPLSDSDPFDSQSGGNTSIRYCAYDASCTNLVEAQLDPDADSTNQVTAIIETVLPGESGFVRFEVNIAPQQNTTTISNQAELQFDTAGATRPRTYSNAINFTVLTTAGVVVNGSQATSIDGMNEPVSVVSAPLAGKVTFENIVWNTGNTVDTFNIEVDATGSTFPANTVYRLLKSDAATPLQDTNQDGFVDTGPVQPGQYSIVVTELQLPFGFSGNNGGVGFDLSKLARSSSDATIFNAVVDHLDEIVSNQVDLTNQAPAGSSGALGVGPGPEVAPVSTADINANGQVPFDLYIRHQGSVSASYDISAHATASGGALPSDWQVQFTQVSTGQPITNTGSLASGESLHVLATVQVPNVQFDSVKSIFFKVTSPQNGASDIKYDAIRAAPRVQLELNPSLTAQVNPGGNVVYEHVITNAGNIQLDDIEFTVQNSLPAWQAILYADTDSNGFLSPADLPIAGALSLQAGESADVFLKVFSPAAAPLGQQNSSTINVASASSGASSQAIDVTTVSESQVNIRKEQAVDTGCDGQPDAGLDFSPAQIDVAPGNNCVLYRLTATNTGVNPSYNVTIHDYTPPYTLYHSVASCSRTPCWINEPNPGETGTINAETDQLQPGDSYFLQFSVRVQ